MQKVWTILKILAVILLALLFAKNTHEVVLHLYFGYSAALPLFLWLALVTIFGIILGYFAARLQFWNWKRQHYHPTHIFADETKKEPSSSSNSPISSLADAFRAAPASPKGEDEHGHYGI